MTTLPTRKPSLALHYWKALHSSRRSLHCPSPRESSLDCSVRRRPALAYRRRAQILVSVKMAVHSMRRRAHSRLAPIPRSVVSAVRAHRIWTPCSVRWPIRARTRWPLQPLAQRMRECLLRVGVGLVWRRQQQVRVSLPVIAVSTDY